MANTHSLITQIESQNLMLVDVLQQVRDTTHQIKLSRDYAIQTKVKQRRGKTGEAFGDVVDGTAFDEAMDDDQLEAMMAAGHFDDA